MRLTMLKCLWLTLLLDICCAAPKTSLDARSSQSDIGDNVSCPYLVHYIPQAEGFFKANERCINVGGNLPQRNTHDSLCLARFFSDVTFSNLSSIFSGTGSKDFGKQVTLNRRLWFYQDDQDPTHKKRIDDKRAFACFIPVASKPDRCNSSVIVNTDSLKYNMAQESCLSKDSRLPSRTNKQELYCFKEHFPDSQLTWLDGMRVSFEGQPLPLDQCTLSDREDVKACPEGGLRFICISTKYKPDYQVQIAPAITRVRDTNPAVTEQGRTSIEEVAEQSSQIPTLQLATDSLERPFGYCKTPVDKIQADNICGKTDRYPPTKMLQDGYTSTELWTVVDFLLNKGILRDTDNLTVWTAKDSDSKQDTCSSVAFENIRDPQARKLTENNKEECANKLAVICQPQEGGIDVPLEAQFATVLSPINDTLALLHTTLNASSALAKCVSLKEMKVFDSLHSQDEMWSLIDSFSSDILDPFNKSISIWAFPREHRNDPTFCTVLTFKEPLNRELRTISVNGNESCSSLHNVLCETAACPTVVEPGLLQPWSRLSPLRSTIAPCSKVKGATYEGNLSKICNQSGYWEPTEGTCILPGVSNTIEQNIRENPSKAIEDLYINRAVWATDYSSGIKSPEEALDKTKEFMETIFKEAIGSVSSKEEIGKTITFGQTFIAKLADQLDNDANLTSSSGNIAYSVQKVNLNGPMLQSRKGRTVKSTVGGSEVMVTGLQNLSNVNSVVVGHVVFDTLPENITTFSSSGPWADAELNTKLVEFFIAISGADDKLHLDGSQVRISFQNTRPTAGEVVKCVFLDTINLVYSDYGCQFVANESTENTTVCHCNHTTSFASLLLPSDEALSQTEFKFLQYMTVIGMPLSIICLIVCILVFTFIRQLHELRNIIHRNLCICLLVGDILLIGVSHIDFNWDCLVPGALLHFWFLSSLSWMGLEGIHIIHLMWKVFSRSRSHSALYYIAGYLLPLVVVIATVFSFRGPYEKTAELCFLARDNLAILTFILPLMLVIAINVVAISMVFWRMRTVKSATEESILRSAHKWIRGVAVLVPLLGLPWIVGLFMYSSSRYVVTASAIVFNVSLILQGPGIFFCHVWFSKKKRDAIARYLNNKGWLAGVIAKLFKRTGEALDSSTKSSKLSKSSQSTKKNADSTPESSIDLDLKETNGKNGTNNPTSKNRFFSSITSTAKKARPVVAKTLSTQPLHK